MNPGRTAVAYLLGILAVVLIVIAWWIGMIAAALRASDCSGGYGISCSTSNGGLIVFVVWAILITAIAASVLFWTIRSLGRWASEAAGGRGPSVVAGAIVGVLAVAAAVTVAFYVTSSWDGG